MSIPAEIPAEVTTCTVIDEAIVGADVDSRIELGQYVQ
jgi:hypothetical protein